MSRNPFDVKLPSSFYDIGSSSENRPRKKINKNLKDSVWLKYMGNKMEGKCYCCRIRTIHATDFEVGHNKAHAKGGSDDISNLRPICRSCNSGMGTKSIEWYREKYYSKPRKEKKGEKATKKKKSRKRRSSNPLGIPTVKIPKLKLPKSIWS